MHVYVHGNSRSSWFHGRPNSVSYLLIIYYLIIFDLLELARFQGNELQPYLLGTLFLILVEMGISFAWEYGIVAITTQIVAKFQENLFAHMVYQDLEFHEKIRTGEKMVKLSGDNILSAIHPNQFDF